MRTSPALPALAAVPNLPVPRTGLFPTSPLPNPQPGVTADTPTGAPSSHQRLVAHPDSPVGRPLPRTTLDPLADVDLDLPAMSDRQLHALTSALLEEKHRRAEMWLNIGRATS